MRAMARITAVLAALSLAGSVGIRAAAAPENISAVNAILIEAQTGTVLYEKNPDERRAMASTTKIMTALLTIEAGDPDREFTVDPLAIRVEGTSMGLREGDRVSRRDLLYGILLPSGNDAANAAAVSVSGSIPAFVQLMNSRAQELGLYDTHFVTPSGLDADGHYTTARDLAKLTAFAMRDELFRSVVSCSSAEVEFGNPPYKRTLYNSNKMLRRYDGAIGVKTGFTDNARRCLGCGFRVAVAGTGQSVGVYAHNASMALLDGQRGKLTRRVLLPSFVYGTVEKGDRLGELEFLLDGEVVLECPLYADSTVTVPEQQPGIFREILARLGVYI